MVTSYIALSNPEDPVPLKNGSSDLFWGGVALFSSRVGLIYQNRDRGYGIVSWGFRV